MMSQNWSVESSTVPVASFPETVEGAIFYQSVSTKTIDLIFLSFLAVIGTFGNLMVIASIIFAGRILKSGNLFIINLAVADLIVSGIYVPTIVANVVKGENTLTPLLCKATGYIITVSCVCSVANLTCIAVNRYLVIAHPCSYRRRCSKQKLLYAIASTWIWSNLISSPTFLGWSDLIYDEKMVGCSWDDTASVSYNILFMTLAVFIPVIVICICYWKLYKCVKGQVVWVRHMGLTPDKIKRRQKEELSLLRTLATAIIIFLACWTPYAFCTTFFPKEVPLEIKKVFCWCGITNSVMNFIIYGAMNKTYYKGYKDLLLFICCRKRQTVRTTSTVILSINSRKGSPSIPCKVAAQPKQLCVVLSEETINTSPSQL